LCPALPNLCNALALDFGLPNIITKSIKPISIPNSKEVEQTTTFNFPSLSLSSISNLESLLKEDDEPQYYRRRILLGNYLQMINNSFCCRTCIRENQSCLMLFYQRIN